MALASLLLAALATPSAPLLAEDDLLTVYSAGVERIALDRRDRALAELLGNLGEWIQSAAATGDETIPAAALLATRWITQPMCLRVAVSAADEPRLQVDVRFGDRTEALREYASLREALGETGISLPVAGDEAVQAPTPGGTLAAHLVHEDDSSTLSLALGRALAEPFEVPRAKLSSSVEPVFTARWNGRALATVLDDLALEDEEGRTLRSVLDRLGIAGRGASTYTFGIGHGDVESMSTTWVDGWRGAENATLLAESDLTVFPADTLWAWTGGFRPSEWVDLLRELGPEFEEGLAEASEETGVDLDELFLSMGPVAGAYVSGGTGGSAGPAGLVFFTRCRMPIRLKGSLEELLEKAAENGFPLRPQRWTFEGHACTTYSMLDGSLPFEPTLAAAGDRVFLTLGRAAAKEALEQLGRKTSLVDHPRLAELSERSLSNLVGLGFSDDPKFLEQGFASLQMFQATLGGLSQSAPELGELAGMMPDFTALLPTLNTLRRGARPALKLSYLQGDDLLTATTHDRSWTARLLARLGHPAGAVSPMTIGLVSSIAIPKLLSARLSANESAAIATLRTIRSAQTQFQFEATADRDGDGEGEFGSLRELAGVEALPSGRPLPNGLLSSAFGETRPDGCRGDVVQRSGYWFQVWRPGQAGTAHPDGATNGSLDADGAESRWWAYAWPNEAGSTGLRAFYVDQTGELYALDNQNPGSYQGLCGEGGNQPEARAIDRGRWTQVQ